MRPRATKGEPIHEQVVAQPIKELAMPVLVQLTSVSIITHHCPADILRYDSSSHEA